MSSETGDPLSESASPLVELYERNIGESETRDEAFGYWLFVLGILLGFFGIVLFLMSSRATMMRGGGIAIAAIGLLLLVAGPIIRLRLRRAAELLSYLGIVMGLLAVAWFIVAYPDNWGSRTGDQSQVIIALYGLGLAVVALGGIFVPLTTNPRVKEEREAREAAEAEAERAQRAEESAKESARETREAADAEVQRMEEEVARIRDSQSQFEVYEDSAGEYRWRLRHRNGNIIADGGEGYASKQKAKQGIAAVKRDALGGAVVEVQHAVDEEEAESVEEEEELEPEYTPDLESQGTFEVYEDNAGEYRWRLRHENGNIIADGGQGYSSQGSAEDAVERVREYAVAADYLRLDPVAFQVYHDNAGEYRWRLLHENGNIIADSGEGYARRSDARNGLESVKRNVGEDGNAEFEVYEDNAGEYRWRLRHENGNIIADGGQGYSSESGAEDAVERVREYAPDAFVLEVSPAAFEVYEDEAGEYRWRLRHRNGNILGDSGQGYASRTGAVDGVHSVKRNAPDADVEVNPDEE